jgi:hypothetical protein
MIGLSRLSLLQGVAPAMIRRTKGFRLLALMLAAYSLLASARELVPGLCATLAAVKEGAPACDPVTRSCCSGPESDSGDTRIHSEGRPHAPCAFCNLAKGLIKSEAAAAAPCNPARPEVAHARPIVFLASARLCAESRPRDPPSRILA